MSQELKPEVFKGAGMKSCTPYIRKIKKIRTEKMPLNLAEWRSLDTIKRQRWKPDLGGELRGNILNIVPPTLHHCYWTFIECSDYIELYSDNKSIH